MMMVMVMMVMMVVSVLFGLYVAMILMAMLALLFQFDRYVADAMLRKLLSDMLLDLVGILVGNGV